MSHPAYNQIDAGSSPPLPTAVPRSILEYLHACLICGSPKLRHYCRVPSLFNAGEFIRYERCGGCGTVMRNPRLPAAARLERYEHSTLSADWKRLDPKTQAHYRVMLRWLLRLAETERPRLLDFGSGAGGFLLEAQAAGLEDVMGLELNRDLAAHTATTHGIRVFQGLIDDSRFATERFDVIVSNQVFEHLVDPRATLRQVREHLVDRGLIFVEVPNLLHFRERLRRGATMDDSHLFYFSARGLSWMLAAEGFEVLAVFEGLRPHRFLPKQTSRAPLWALNAVEKCLAALQIKTALGMIARLRSSANLFSLTRGPG